MKNEPRGDPYVYKSGLGHISDEIATELAKIVNVPQENAVLFAAALDVLLFFPNSGKGKIFRPVVNRPVDPSTLNWISRISSKLARLEAEIQTAEESGNRKYWLNIALEHNFGRNTGLMASISDARKSLNLFLEKEGKNERRGRKTPSQTNRRNKLIRALYRTVEEYGGHVTYSSLGGGLAGTLMEIILALRRHGILRKSYLDNLTYEQVRHALTGSKSARQRLSG